eukprot:s868_g18.t1
MLGGWTGSFGTFDFNFSAPVQGGIAPGAIVEAEWVIEVGHSDALPRALSGSAMFAMCNVTQVSNGALTIKYDDGYLQRNVAMAQAQTYYGHEMSPMSKLEDLKCYADVMVV